MRRLFLPRPRDRPLEQDDELNEFGNERNAGGNGNKGRSHWTKRSGILDAVPYLHETSWMRKIK